jgi:hypothetical protein
METSNIAIKRKLVELINSDSIITEVACGGGWLAEFIATLKPKAYIGFDFAETAASNAAKRLQGALGKQLGRPRTTDNEEIVRLSKSGLSYRAIQKKLRVSAGSIRRALTGAPKTPLLIDPKSSGKSGDKSE